MHILTVIPIARGIPREELSYFSAKAVALGTLVTVPFGKRSIKGVVIDQQPARDLKGSLKSSNFALRNVTTIHAERLPQALFTAGQKSASFFAQPVGAVLETMIPHQLFDYYLTHPVTEPAPASMRPDIQALQINTAERISYYKILIRENLARNLSTMIVAPSIIQAEKIFQGMKTGIEDHITILHSKKTKKHIEKTIEKMFTSKTPIVHISTAPFSACVRPDWHTVIIEQSSSNHYRYPFKPVFDTLFFIESFAHHMHARLIYADTLLDVTIRDRIARREIIDARSTWHITKPELTAFIDMKKSDEPDKKASFAPLHPRTLKLITRAQTESAQMLIITTRKGLAPITTCSDCGTAVTCPICQTPLVLHKARVYLCHHCMHTTEPQDQCTACGSWKLTPLGIATEMIAETISETFPKAKISIVDGDHGTPTSIQKTITAWQETPGGILIATPIILAYLDSCTYGCIVSMDSLLSLPHYTSGMRALHTAVSFLEKISARAIIQTRNHAHDVIQALEHDTVFEYVQSEITTRTQFRYPPSCVLVKLSLEVKKSQAKEALAYCENILKPYDPDLLMKKSKSADTIIVQALLRLDPALWNDSQHDIHYMIKTMGPDWRVEVNPESVL